MGLLQGPRLMARTTKSPIRRNHWVPLGCRGHLGSVNRVIRVELRTVDRATKAELLQEGISFLIHLFARDVLVMKKLEIEKTKPTFIISVLKVEY